MVINPKQTAFAYFCPKCGSGVKSIVGAFSLSGDMIKLKCECGGSELVITKAGNDSFRLSIPCMFCGNSHLHTVSRKLLLESEMFCIPCAITGVDLFYAGSENNVNEAVGDNIRYIETLITDKQREFMANENNQRKIGEYFDEHIIDMVDFVVDDMIKEHDIICGCGKDGEYKVEKSEAGITVRCERCKRSAFISGEATPATHAFIEADNLTLE